MRIVFSCNASFCSLVFSCSSSPFFSWARLSFKASSFWIFSICTRALLQVSSSSSISLRRPSRLLLFLKAPPVMEPPALKSSPSRVTMRRLYLYFLARAMALSMVSTTTTRPRRYRASPLYCPSTWTRSWASPRTPFSLRAAGCEKFWLPLMLVRGRKVALPYRFFFRYSISCLAVASESVTMFCMLPPRAVSMAISYFCSVEMISATTPWIPWTRSRTSMTRRMLLPYPSYRSARFFKDSSLV